jgi:hypothetical protein
MTAQPFNVAEEVRRLLAEGMITPEAIHAVTGIAPEALRSFLADAEESQTTGLTAKPQVLSGDQAQRLSAFAAQLTEGMRIGADERLKAIFEGLTLGCGLTTGNLARLTGLRIEDLDSILRDPSSVPVETRYQLAIKGAYLINAVNLARER